MVSVIKKKVVPDWRARISDYSTIALAAVSALIAIWISIPSDLKGAYPAFVTDYFSYLILALTLWGGVGKFVIQRPKVEE